MQLKAEKKKANNGNNKLQRKHLSPCHYVTKANPMLRAQHKKTHQNHLHQILSQLMQQPELRMHQLLLQRSKIAASLHTTVLRRTSEILYWIQAKTPTAALLKRLLL